MKLQNLINSLSAYTDQYSTAAAAILEQYSQDNDYKQMRSAMADIAPDGTRFVNRWNPEIRSQFSAVVFP
ncbi:hypothetical protein MVI27_09795 [Chryseobacterium salipaludis]|uniref:hypothetical protein n=1 Tax=Chryseobacterium TaxID=59732 RepID=UPI001FF6A077|nr:MULTISPECIES: hypothetical protein [Chryseobacterium]MCJ8498553.1 hypothetical protein [Chryseobacterium salipaludis]MCX3297122.1 hypothetical protein [Planobacterium sp. JC490]